VLVAACSQRKHIRAEAALSLASVASAPDDRVREWRRRLARIPAPRQSAQDTYAGDHWHAVLDAYKLASAYSSGTELWVISAGYGLIPSDKRIKAYSATFATGNPDSVWRGRRDGERIERLQKWWHGLAHQVALEELLPTRGGGSMLIAAGAAYLTALDGDIDRLLAAAPTEETLSLISAGTRGNGALLPVSGQLRSAVGGTDSALNARTLRLLAATADEHQFRHTEMERLLTRLARTSKPTIRRRGRSVTDTTIAAAIRSLRRGVPGISRTGALRELRASGIACEQDRFAAIWASVAGKRI
jgi:hypothetical protein